MIDAAHNAQRVGDDRIGGHSTEIVGRQSLQDFVGQSIGRIEGELEGFRIRDSGAVEVGGLDPAFHCHRRDLLGRSMHQEDPDVQRA